MSQSGIAETPPSLEVLFVYYEYLRRLTYYEGF